MLCDYPGCATQATHVLIDYHHRVIEEGDERGDDGRHFCRQHAFEDGREACPVCVAATSTSQLYDESAEEDVELLRTYPAGTLDGEGCCSDHP